jgi:hypothetical protein
MSAMNFLDGMIAELEGILGESPSATSTGAAPPTPPGGNADELKAKITAQGQVVVTMKADKAEAAAIKEAVALLLKLKAEHKALTGEDFPAGGGKKSKKDKKKAAAPAAKKADKRAVADPNQPEITKLDIRVGKIVKVWNHETADKVSCIIIIIIQKMSRSRNSIFLFGVSIVASGSHALHPRSFAVVL